MLWSLVEAKEDDGEVTTHIVPTVKIDGFDTGQEAIDFGNKCTAAGYPVLTDENGAIRATYFGHTLSKDCVCNPKVSETDPGLYTHRAAN